MGAFLRDYSTAVARRTRILVVLPSGGTVHQSVSEVELLIEKKRATWIEKGISALRVVSQQYVDYSGIAGDHIGWEPTPSGGAVVMQLI